MTTAIIAPARLASARFPEKLLHQIHGKPLIVWVAQRLAEQVPGIQRYFAVDDARLAKALEADGHTCLMTRKDHSSGTDRLAEANASIGADVVINVQADEPLVTVGQIRSLQEMIEGGAEMATLATPFSSRDDFLDPNQVKVVVGADGRALYFSRSPIPYPRDSFASFGDDWVAEAGVHRHLGLYSYRASFLDTFCNLSPGKLETIERLEQLRALESGHAIQVSHTAEPSIGIDTPEDAERFSRLVRS